MLYSCTHMATVGVKGLTNSRWLSCDRNCSVQPSDDQDRQKISEKDIQLDTDRHTKWHKHKNTRNDREATLPYAAIAGWTFATEL